MLHGVGETPPLWDQEIDVSLIYDDYYFLEALKRRREIFKQTSVTYVPEPDFYGVDSFNYVVCESAGGCAKGTVTVRVEPPAPVLRITLEPDSDRLALSFTALRGVSYSLDYIDNFLPGATWKVMHTDLSDAGATISILETNTVRTRFYRLRISLP